VSIAHAIWQHNAKSPDGRSLNLSAIASAAKLRIATIWTYHHAKARWTADTWIRAMLITGGAELMGDHLVVKLPEGLNLPAAIPNAYKNRRKSDK
jgi:hypothetical protein